jgi:hypothetical protein
MDLGPGRPDASVKEVAKIVPEPYFGKINTKQSMSKRGTPKIWAADESFKIFSKLYYRPKGENVPHLVTLFGSRNSSNVFHLRPDPETIKLIGRSTYQHRFCSKFFFLKEVARGGERTRVLSISFIFTFFTTLPLSPSGSPYCSKFVTTFT